MDVTVHVVPQAIGQGDVPVGREQEQVEEEEQPKRSEKQKVVCEVYNP